MQTSANSWKIPNSQSIRQVRWTMKIQKFHAICCKTYVPSNLPRSCQKSFAISVSNKTWSHENLEKVESSKVNKPLRQSRLSFVEWKTSARICHRVVKFPRLAFRNSFLDIRICIRAEDDRAAKKSAPIDQSVYVRWSVSSLWNRNSAPSKRNLAYERRENTRVEARVLATRPVKRRPRTGRRKRILGSTKKKNWWPPQDEKIYYFIAYGFSIPTFLPRTSEPYKTEKEQKLVIIERIGWCVIIDSRQQFTIVAGSRVVSPSDTVSSYQVCIKFVLHPYRHRLCAMCVVTI